MITFDDYKSILSANGENLSQIRKNDSDRIMNDTFTSDIGYKKVYLLDPVKGWTYTDAKYSKHATSSIQKDQVDSYLQFRPKEHHPIGTYVFIPDDTSFDLDNVNFDDPLNGDTSNMWMIVNRNDAKQFVRYHILKINWNFKWVTEDADKIKVEHCWGCVRNANSYTSGIWNDYYVNSLDNLTSAWLPNTHYIFGDKCSDYGLCDTRSLAISKRVMITLNQINPTCYMVTKVLDMVPKGLIKYYMKQDDFNPKRDNVKLFICDYYNNEGDIVVDKPDVEDQQGTSEIKYMVVNDDGELEESSMISSVDTGKLYYFNAEFSDSSVSAAEWRVDVVGDYTDEEKAQLERLITIREVNPTTISFRPGKSNRIKGLTFKLTVCDHDGNYTSSIDLEVSE